MVASKLVSKQQDVPDAFPEYEGLEEGQPSPEEIERRLEHHPFVRSVPAEPEG